MEAVREKWTDERLDDLNGKVDVGFARLDARLDRVDARIDGLSKAVIIGALTISGTMLTGFIAVFTLIAMRS
jgi:hypothetical protein